MVCIYTYKGVIYTDVDILKSKIGSEKKVSQSQMYDILIAAESQLMEKLPLLLKRTGHTSLENLMLDYGFTMDSKEGKIKLLMELAARWAETLVDKPQPTWWKQLINSMTEWIKKFVGKTLTENEVNELVGQFVKYGTDSTTTKSFNQFQQSLNNPNTNPVLLGTTSPDVILPIGTSGSGKSTFIKSLPQENLVVIEPDAMRVEFTGDMNDKSKDKEIYIEAANRAIKAIKAGKQVVFDTTNLTKDKRLPFIEAIKKVIPTANIQYKLMELNPELAKQRIKAQIERGENRANVSEETIDRHAESYKQMLEDIKNEPITNFDYKEEQLKKFNELQELINNNEFIQGAKLAFESSEELQNVYYEAAGFKTTENKNSVYPILNKKEAINTLQNRVKELEKELLLTFEGKGRRNEFWINEDIRTWEKIIKTLEENDNINVTNVFKNQTLGKDLSDKKGVEVFELESNNVLKVGVLFEKTVDVINAGKKVSSPRIHPFTEFHWFKNEFAAVATKAKGVPLKRGEKLRLSELEKQNLYSDLAQIENAELTIDTSKHNNFYYNKGEGIHFIDLGAETITANEKNNNFFLDNFFENTSSEEFRKLKESFKLETQITPQQKQDALNAYTDYIARVSLGIIKNPTSGEFNNSVVKDIVYHGASKDFQGFIKNKKIIPKGKTKGGIWFTDFANADWVYKEEEGKVIAALINLKNPIEYKTERYFDDEYGDYLNSKPLKEGQWKDVQQLIDNKQGDGLLLDIFDATTSGDIGEFTKQQVVFEPEQIHILSSKQDIEGFKDFVTQSSTTIKPEVQKLFNSNPELVNKVYEILGFKTAKQYSTSISSTIYELIPNITEEKINEIYENYVSLMNKTRVNKEITKEVFKNLLKQYQVFNYKNTYIFGHYDSQNGVFITRINSSPSSKELLAEALPKLVSQGIHFASFVPKDVADKYQRSGYSVSTHGFDYNFKGENMIKYLAVSDPNIALKLFSKNVDEVSSNEIEDFNNKQQLKYIPVEIKGDLIEMAGKESSKIFETYLNQFGIIVKDIDIIKNQLGIDELGFADILSKIAYVKDKKDLPPIAGEFIAYMMQYNPLVVTIIDELIQTNAITIPKKSYRLNQDGNKIYNYKTLDKTEFYKYIGNLIAKDLQNKLEGNYQKSLVDKIKELIKVFYNYLTNTEIDKINVNIGIITNNILQQNKKLITASLYKPGAFGKPTKQVSLKEAMDSDKFGASIINKLSKQGFILTGSTSLGEQGTIQRPNENLLHDIDWVSPFDKKQTETLFKEIYPNAIKIRDIYNDEFVTDTWLIAPEGYEIINIQKTDGYNIIISYDVIDHNNKIVGNYRLQKQKENNQNEEIVTGIEAKIIDFFSYDKYNQLDPFEKDGIKLTNWKEIFKAKLQFARYKDIWDYNRFIPNDNIYEITPDQKQQALQLYSQYLDTGRRDIEGFKDFVNNKKNEVVKESNNQSLQDGLQWLKQIMPDVEPLLVDGLIDNIANGKYDILNDVITLSEDFANKGVVKEEVFHRVFSLLPKEEQEKLLNEGSKKYGIERGESTATIKYSLADQNKIEYGLKAIEILQSDKAKQVFAKGEKAGWDLNKTLTELQISKEQKELILSLGKTDREEIITDLLANYSYIIEINTAKKEYSKNYTRGNQTPTEDRPYGNNTFEINNVEYSSNIMDGGYKKYENGKYYNITAEEYKKAFDSFEKTYETIPTSYYSNLTVPGGTNYTENEIATPAITPSIKGHAQFSTDNGIGWFRSDEQVTNGKYEKGKIDRVAPDGTLITDISGGTVTKTRRILELQSDLFQKGRDRKDLVQKGVKGLLASEPEGNTGVGIENSVKYQVVKRGNKYFAEAFYEYPDAPSDLAYSVEQGDNFNSYKEFDTKEEADSYLIELKDKINDIQGITKNSNENQFLQLLNKDNNWVTFFVKSIIQDSAKKGYEKVLFPSGNTASKVEGHTTLEEFKREKEDRIKVLEKEINSIENAVEYRTYLQYGYVEKFQNKDNSFIYYYNNGFSEKEIDKSKYDELLKNSKNNLTSSLIYEKEQLEQELERVETEGFGALKPIYNFYENTVTNILNKIYGKENVKQITDEYGNTWNEITITPKMSETIRLNTPNGKIEYTGDLAIEEKIAEEAYNSKDENISTTLIGKFIQSIKNLFRNIFYEKDNISRLIRKLNQGGFKLNNQKTNTTNLPYRYSITPIETENDIQLPIESIPYENSNETEYDEELINRVTEAQNNIEDILQSYQTINNLSYQNFHNSKIIPDNIQSLVTQTLEKEYPEHSKYSKDFNFIPYATLLAEQYAKNDPKFYYIKNELLNYIIELYPNINADLNKKVISLIHNGNSFHFDTDFKNVFKAKQLHPDTVNIKDYNLDRNNVNELIEKYFSTDEKEIDFDLELNNGLYQSNLEKRLNELSNSNITLEEVLRENNHENYIPLFQPTDLNKSIKELHTVHENGYMIIDHLINSVAKPMIKIEPLPIEGSTDEIQQLFKDKEVKQHRFGILFNDKLIGDFNYYKEGDRIKVLQYEVEEEPYYIKEFNKVSDAINISFSQIENLDYLMENIDSNIRTKDAIDYKKPLIFKNSLDFDEFVLNAVFPTLELKENKNIIILNQPNNQLRNTITNNPKINKLNFEDTIKNRWVIKFLTTSKEGNNILNNSKSIEEVNKKLNDYFDSFENIILESNDYFLTDIPDKLIEENLNSTEAEIDSQFRMMWQEVKDDKEKYIQQRNEEQRENMLMNFNMFKNTSHYSIGFKLLLLESLLKRNITYDNVSDKVSDKPRDNKTIGVQPVLNELILAKLEESSSTSGNKIMHDYFYEDANYKGEKVNLNDYTNNVYKETEEGTWFKFEGENDVDKFHKMSSLSAGSKGAWCTGAYGTAKSYLLGMDGKAKSEMYIFYSNSENQPILQLHIINDKAVEIGGLDIKQDFRNEKDFEIFNEFISNESNSFGAGELLNYLNYKKALLNIDKIGFENLDYNDLKSIYEGVKYYKDSSYMLEDYQKILPKSFYGQYYNVDENLIKFSIEYKFKNIKELNENSTLIKDIKKGVIIIGDIILENLEKINLKDTLKFDSNIKKINLKNLTSTNVSLIFNNKEDVILDSLESIDYPFEFYNDGEVKLSSLKTIKDSVIFNQSYFLILGELTSIEAPVYTNRQRIYNDILPYNIDMVILTPNDVEQNESNNYKGTFIKDLNNTYLVFGNDSDLTTAVHEKAHEYEKVLTINEILTLESWSGYKKGTKEFSEAFAVGAEKYIYDGAVSEDPKLNEIFRQFKIWFKGLIRNAVNYFKDINELNDEVKAIYQEMMSSENRGKNLRDKSDFKQYLKENQRTLVRDSIKQHAAKIGMKYVEMENRVYDMGELQFQNMNDFVKGFKMDEETKEVFKYLEENHLDRLNKIQIIETNQEIPAYYKNGKIYINTNLIKETSIANELLQLLTLDIINNPTNDADTNFVNNLKELYDEFKRETKDRELNYITNINEFLTYTLTNNKMQQYLSKINEPLVNNIIYFIKSFFNIQYDSILNDIFNSNKQVIRKNDNILFQKDPIKDLAIRYNMNTSGFMPSHINPIAVKNEIRNKGLNIELKQADRGGGYYFIREGRFYNPFKFTKQIEGGYTEIDVLKDFSNNLSERFNIEVKLITMTEAEKLIDNYNGESSFYNTENQTAYLVIDRADETSAIHEIFTHPFLILIEKHNTELYNNLLNEAKSNKEVVQYVIDNYGKIIDHEIIARYIDLETRGELNRKNTIIDYIKDFYNNLSSYLKSLFNLKEVTIEQLSPNITLKELTQLILNSRIKIDLKREVSNKVNNFEDLKEADKFWNQFNDYEIQQFLNHKFPNNRLVYRTDNNGLNHFNYSTNPSLKFGNGIYLTSDLNYTKDNSKNKTVYPVLLNSNNVLEFNNEIDYYNEVAKYFNKNTVPTKEEQNRYIEEKHKEGYSIYIKNSGIIDEVVTTNDNIVILNTESIHNEMLKFNNDNNNFNPEDGIKIKHCK